MLSNLFEAQRGHLFLWMPVALGAGIWLYFTLRWEPSAAHYQMLGIMAIILAVLAKYGRFAISLAARTGVFITLGFLLIAFRTHTVSAPVLSWHYYGPVEGRIVGFDRSSGNKLRITIDHVVLAGFPKDKTPRYLRISLHSQVKLPILQEVLKPGSWIMTTASLSPPMMPAEPGGFDFQRYAWFRALGAVGYTHMPVLRARGADRFSLSLHVFEIRMALAKAIRGQIPGQTGAFAAAIITGDRSALDPAMLGNLRDANLAHLLAISGLHMGLLTGFVFAMIRYGMALTSYLALRLPTKKIAATVALLTGFTYLLISGGNVATQRAFIMVSVMLIAILLDRAAITLRAVAIAALIVLILRPESLIEAGFQMSFAATTALVGSFETLSNASWWRRLQAGNKRWLQPFVALVISSAIAGAATAPFSAYHFNQFAQFGLVANILCVPVMAVLVMPAAVIAGVLSLIGLSGLALPLMGLGISWILGVSAWVAALEGAAVPVASPDQFILPYFALGALLLILGQGRIRFIGVPVILLGGIIWMNSHRPDVLVSQSGRLIGVMTPSGRALNRDKGDGFVARNWLENDGDRASQADAAKRLSLARDRFQIALKGRVISYDWKQVLAGPDINAKCLEVDVLILPRIAGATSSGRCLLIDKDQLKRLGSIQIYMDELSIRISGARQISGKRLWH